MLGVFATLGLVFAEGAVGLFRDDPDVTAIGTDALRFQCISLYVIPIMVTTNMLLQSSGQKLAASFTAMLRNGIYYIPLLLILSNTVGLKGIQMTQMTADLLSVATCIPIAGNFLHRLKILDEKKE
jgi:Na+-driven multidrug efflux pump